MSPHRLEQGPIVTDVDARIANLVTAFTLDLDNPDRDTVLWLLENWRHARRALRILGERAAPESFEAKMARAGLRVVGE